MIHSVSGPCSPDLGKLKVLQISTHLVLFGDHELQDRGPIVIAEFLARQEAEIMVDIRVGYVTVHDVLSLPI